MAAIYLTSLLTGERRAEASELPVRRVSFQTSPDHPVDDLLVEYSSGTSKVTIAIACRATPNFVQSDEQTVKLVSSLLKEITKFNTNDHQVAVAVAGWRTQWEQLATVCDIARSNADAAFFKASLDVEKRWSKKVRERLDQFLMMVNLATENMKTEAEVFSLAFMLLSRLHILGFAVQSPDERDRTAAATALDAVARDAVDGIILRNRLEVEATRYDTTGAVVDLNLLRRDLHTLLEATTTRNTRVWETLADHRRVADASVRTVLGEASATSDALSIAFADRRDDLISSIRKTGADATALIVSGESGTGKSALTLSCITQLEEEDPTGFEALVVNFRALPQTSMEFRAAIGASIADVLAELSAPTRVLVIDAADAAFERSAILLNDLVLAAKQAGIGVVAVSSDTAQEFVNEQLALGFDKAITSFNMQLLSDADLEAVAEHFPLLRTVLRNLPQASLLRRLVVLDLLARTGIKLKSQISEWDCLDLVWKKIVRAEGKPGAGSAEAREQTLLAVAAATLNLSADRQLAATPDPAAVDKLRRDHLLAPASPYLARPEFAHDEVRRYALAILLVRATNMADTLQAGGAPRWALSAATLACKGQLCAPRANAPRVFDRMVQMFNAFAVQHGPRWSDVSVEAALDTSKAYECLKAEPNNHTSPVHLDDVVRIVKQRYQVNGLPDSLVTAPVIQLLLDHAEPWRISESSFELLADWLQSLALLQLPAGHPLRIALRDRLITYWDSFPTLKPMKKDRTDNRSVKLGFGSRPRRRRELPYEVTQNEYIECLALLGPDINDQVEQCLLAIADDAPGFLAPAADSPLSARAIALHDPELLATLMEAYYIDDEDTDWDFHEGIRDHQGRWKGFSPPFYQYYYGSFWALFNFASYKTSVRVLNNILNHGARVRVRPRAGLGVDPFEGTPDHGPEEQHETGAELNLDGTSRFYVGDTHVWSWYRGTSVGPYSGMSALLAMERVAEGWLDTHTPPSWIVNALLENCENLAVPGMLYGLLTRHIDKINEELDPFLAEPTVWELEFGRVIGEHSGLRARTDDLRHQERRNWSPHEVCVTLMTRGNEGRVQALKAVGDLLISNGDRLGVPREHTRNWAASLDANQYKLTQEDGQIYLQVDPPKELEATQAKFALYQDQVNTGLRLQNRYWGSAKHNADYVPPTSAEIAQDLSTARELLDANNDIMPTSPLNAAAHVVRLAVQRAAVGDLEALGSETEFVAQLVLQLALAFQTSDDQRDEGQYFDLGADRAIAHALPAFLTPALADLLPPIGATTADVEDAGMAVAGTAPLETRLYLTRGCDIVWDSPCHGTPCIHKTAISWVLETARGAELGAWEMHNQRRSRVYIEGDVPTRLQELDGTSIDLSMLNASIRGLGAAAAAHHCYTNEAARLLAQFLDVQRRTMVTHAGKRWGVDHRGDYALVAARAILDNYASYRAVRPVLDHLDVLSVDADLLSGFLHSLAAAGAENDRRAQAARDLWPTVLDHALTYASQSPSPYRDRHWGDWAAAALLPEPLSWTQGLYNELAGAPIEWVNAEDLLDLIDQWVPLGRAKTKCVDALIRILRKLPVAEQVARGLDWITELCSRNGQVVINQTWGSNDWLKEIRSTAEELDELHKWQKLVDAMVVAGNEDLAPYSR
ncbi:ATP-binding protein [Corynebacterium hylobatis]|uniref:ATP-binding protein n=1 Tax=Corynebacterium hylobatis TaxID=1859290 RepID=A0A3S0HF19_9CORY|nr:ATP-binding protein [Corynebacterium hylobatis]